MNYKVRTSTKVLFSVRLFSLNSVFNTGHLMINLIKKSSLYLAAISVALMLTTGQAVADRYYDSQRDHYRGSQDYRYDKKHNNQYRNQNRHGYNKRNGFRHDDRYLINSYYSDKKYRNNCPPGLVKKKNRCQPYGKAQRWKKGQKLAKNTRYYDLPRGLRSQLYAQPDHRYVRVNNDVLMVDNVTNIVIDVLENILR